MSLTDSYSGSNLNHLKNKLAHRRCPSGIMENVKFKTHSRGLQF